ncbi:MAG: uroporphyrinogen-III C-methyltransferase [Cycloclasticus sp.]|nr:uroporphyrinogen-III C-methyltransferase [Cycloclasticus sp.]MBQ0789824.1 uroporphyrinogen-III C-methyltransferase [Cycloclasticus sp.]
MDYLPLFHKLSETPCVVIGGGSVATRKVRLLLDAKALITVIAPDLHDELSLLVIDGKIKHHKRNFTAGDTQGFGLVICATNNSITNTQVSSEAKSQHIPVNVVDQPALCSFIFPAIIDRSPMVIAVSSGGSAPVLSRTLRAKLETLLPHSLGNLAELSVKFRQTVKEHFTNVEQRRIFWERIFSGPIADMCYQGRHKKAEQALINLLAQTDDVKANGKVYLVGGGPGDPELLTLKALRILQLADIIVYDRLVSPEVLNLARRDAERVYVGKQRSDHSVPQDGINELLITLAKQGKRVVRLKGGDPFMFGRGGEEIETLVDENIAFEVVPGITAASGCASYSGIPLTHRDHAQSCLFVTGHLKDNTVNLDWEQLAKPNQTIVIYMGLIGLRQISEKLIERGLAESTPVALVQKGTTAEHLVIISDLSHIANKVDELKPKPPTLIIIGSVVTLHKKLNWSKE